MLHHLNESIWLRACPTCHEPFERGSESCACGQPRPRKRADLVAVGNWPDADRHRLEDVLGETFNSTNWQGAMFGSVMWLGPRRIALSDVVHDGGPTGLTRREASDKVSQLLESAGFLIEGGL